MKKILSTFSLTLLVVIGVAQTPSFQWAKSIGSSFGNTTGNLTISDSLGNVYIIGLFAGTTDFDPGSGSFNITAAAQSVFITKLDALGNFIWAKAFIPSSASSVSNCYSVVVDQAGNVYTTGNFSGTVDFDPGTGNLNLTSNPFGQDIFISKLDASGNFVWAKNVSSNSAIVAYSIDLDLSQNVYVIGCFTLTVDFDPGVGVTNVTADNQDAFILKLDPSGNFVWEKDTEGTSGNAFCFSSTFDISGNLYTTGYFYGTKDFDPGAGVYTMSATGSWDVFISKLDPSGNFLFAKRIGGAGAETTGKSIKVDASGNIYTTGILNGTADFDPGTGTLNLSSFASSDDVFISKLDSLGNFLWAKKIGSSQQDVGNSLDLDMYGDVYTTGYFHGNTDFDPGAGIFNLTASTGYPDIFISKLDATGNFVFAIRAGAAQRDVGASIDLDVAGNIYTTGYFADTADFDPTASVFNLMSLSSVSDVFILKLSQSLSAINEINNETQISIYPNPTNGTFNIFTSEQIKNGSIEIYNSIGELVFSQKIINQQNSIDLKNQASGLYFVKVVSGGEVIGMKKVVKE